MKKLLLSALALVALLATPAMAIDEHAALSSQLSSYSAVTTTTPQTLTLTSVTTPAVNTATNSYLIVCSLTYDVPLGDAVSFQLSNDGTAIAGTSRTVSGRGTITLIGHKEGIAVSKVLALRAVVRTAGTTVVVPNASLAVIGLAGATQ